MNRQPVERRPDVGPALNEVHELGGGNSKVFK